MTPAQNMPHAIPARRVEALAGTLAAAAGLITIVVALFAPLQIVHVVEVHETFIQHDSYWRLNLGLQGYPLGQVALWVSVIALLAVGYGAVVHGRRGRMLGRTLLWSGAALLALDLALSRMVLAEWVAAPMEILAPALLPALALALIASAAAIVTH